MKVYQSQLQCMKGEEITLHSCSGNADNSYPNSETYGYHDFFELEFFEKGEGIYFLNGIPYRVKKGCMYLLAPGDYHRAKLVENSEYHLWNLKISKRAFSERILKKLKDYPRPYCVYLDEETFEFISKELVFLLTCLRQGKYFGIMSQNIVERICIVLLTELAKNPVSIRGGEKEEIGRIESFVNKNFHKTITLKDVAKEMDLSENYIGVYFKKKTGVKFIEYLNQVRLFHAVELLKETCLSIKEIAYKVGFCSPEYLTRVFSVYFKRSPSKMRKELKSANDIV